MTHPSHTSCMLEASFPHSSSVDFSWIRLLHRYFCGVTEEPRGLPWDMASQLLCLALASTPMLPPPLLRPGTLCPWLCPWLWLVIPNSSFIACLRLIAHSLPYQFLSFQTGGADPHPHQHSLPWQHLLTNRSCFGSYLSHRFDWTSSLFPTSLWDILITTTTPHISRLLMMCLDPALLEHLLFVLAVLPATVSARPPPKPILYRFS